MNASNPYGRCPQASWWRGHKYRVAWDLPYVPGMTDYYERCERCKVTRARSLFVGDW